MAKTSGQDGVAVAVKQPVPQKGSPVKVAFPGENEAVTHSSYTFQIFPSEQAEAVEVSIGQGEWQPCRESLGLWWFDWSGYDSGSYRVVARLRRPDGTTALSEPTNFEVKLG